VIYDVCIEPLPTMALIDLKGSACDIAPRLQRLGLTEPAPSHALRADTVEVLRVAREHWLLRAPLQDEECLLSALLEHEPAADTLVVPVSDAYAFFAITGPDARQIMAIASPLQADLSYFAENGATFTEAFGQKALVMRRSMGFDVAFERSYASMAAAFFSRINGGPREQSVEATRRSLAKPGAYAAIP
jgi:sarcosine oxidase gamma subunit